MIAGMMRIKNEARWIDQVLAAALKVCDRVYILDDHSTDATAEICRQFSSVELFPSPFEGLDEARDKNWLFDKVQGSGADWCLSIDGDEVLEDSRGDLREIAGYPIDIIDRAAGAQCFSLRVLYLWNSADQVRIDGVYGRFWRPSFFRIRGGDSFHSTRAGGNFHCGNVPHRLSRFSQRSGARLLHFGYMDPDDRRRKFYWYNLNDPNNLLEDRYLHMIQGDPGGPGAAAKLRHAGPLELSYARNV